MSTLTDFYDLTQPDVKNIDNILARLHDYFNVDMLHRLQNHILHAADAAEWVAKIVEYLDCYDALAKTILTHVVPQLQNTHPAILKIKRSIDCSSVPFVQVSTLNDNALVEIISQIGALDKSMTLQLLMAHPDKSSIFIPRLQSFNDVEINELLIPFCGEQSILDYAFSNAQIDYRNNVEDTSTIDYLVSKIKEDKELAMTVVNQKHINRLFELGSRNYLYGRNVNAFKKDKYMQLVHTILCHRPDLYYGLWSIASEQRAKNILLTLMQPKDLPSYLLINGIVLESIRDPDWMEFILQRWIGKWDILNEMVVSGRVSDNVVRIFSKAMQYKNSAAILEKMEPDYGTGLFKKPCELNPLFAAMETKSKGRWNEKERKIVSLLGTKRLAQLKAYQDEKGPVKDTWKAYMELTLQAMQGKQKDLPEDTNIEVGLLENEMEILF